MEEESSRHLGRQIILALDEQIRRFEGISAFSRDPNCVLRISQGVNRKERLLADGTILGAGDPMIELHWWNEQIAHLCAVAPSLYRGMRLYRQVRYSLISLARYVEQAPELREIVALHGEMIIPGTLDCQRHAGAFRRLGFELVVLPPAASKLGRLWHSLRYLHIRALRWASNPASLRRKGSGASVRCELWISRRDLLQRYSEHSTAPFRGDNP